MDEKYPSGVAVDLSIVIVNWNVCALLQRCLLSLSTGDVGFLSAFDTEIIVVDCASSDSSVEMVRREFPDAQVIASDKNLGYARGNNVGMAEARGRYALLLNPDTEVVDYALAKMVRYLDKHSAVGVLGPALRYPDGSLQSSRRRFPTLSTAFCESTLLHQWFPNNRVAWRYHFADCSPDRTQSVDWLVGAALMIRREAWQQVGPLDEGFFMYFEELDWCRRCRSVGWEIHFLPAAEIIHHEGKSSQQVVTQRTIHFQRSRIRYYRKYFGAGWALVIRLFLLATFAFQLCEETLKWVLGHNRGLRRKRMASYWQVIRSGLATGRNRING